MRMFGDLSSILMHMYKQQCVSNLAFQFISVQQIDEHFKTPDVTNGQLTRLRIQAEVTQRAQRNDRGRLVASLHTN